MKRIPSVFSLIVVSVLLWSLVGSADVVAAETALQIKAPANVYAHLYRPFPAIDGNEIVLEARAKVGPNVGDSWTPSIMLYWSPLHYVAHGQTQDGSFRANHFNIAMSGKRNAGIAAGEWVDLRIVVHSEIQLHLRPDGGDWTMIARIKRPATMMSPPVEIVVGKGFENAVDFTQPNLQNSDEAAGPVGTALFDYVRLIVDGVEIFNDPFASFEAWQSRLDPDHAEQIEFSIIPF